MTDEYPFGNPDDTFDREEARKLAAKCREEGHVIQMNRVGACPMFRHTPYTNNRGVKIDRWSCVSYYPEPMPGRVLLNSPHIVRPWNKDDWEINQITTPWIVGQLMKTWRGRVEVLPVEDSPFQAILNWSDSGD